MKSTHHLHKIIFIALALTLCLPTTLTAIDVHCDDIKVVFARGSGEPMNGANYQAFTTNLQTATKKHAPSLNIGYHELDYPAAGTSTVEEVFTAAITMGEGFKFADSLETGQKNLKTYLSSITKLCPATKFVLAGYSQGALVISKSLPDLKSSQIIYSATFGDPKLYLPEGLGIDPAACHGRNLSNYRQTVPDCHTATGILTALKNYQPQGYKDKLGAWCNAGDFMCGSYFDLANGIMTAHTSYSNNGAYQESADVIVRSIKNYFPDAVSSSITPNRSSRDVAILLDNTNSMARRIQYYSNEATRLATEIIADGGRVALYTYGDLIDSKPQQLCDFTTDLTTFKAALSTIKITDGGDILESALSALLHTMNTLTWHKGASKAIIVLTDTSYHSPDLDGTTLTQVVRRSLEIDPVNIFVITEAYRMPDYRQLVASTSGKVVSFYNADTVTNHLLARPAITLSQEFYSVPIGGNVEFSAIATGKISRYEWDLDCDGEFELTTATPVVTRTFPAPLTGYIQVRAVAESGYFNSASAALRVVDYTPATIGQVRTAINGATARLDFTTQHASATLVIASDLPLGYTTKNQVTITDVVRPTTVSLIPISLAGQLGEPVTVTISPESFIPTSPRTGIL